MYSDAKLGQTDSSVCLSFFYKEDSGMKCSENTYSVNKELAQIVKLCLIFKLSMLFHTKILLFN